MSKKFNGIINLDVRNSKPDWTPYTLQKAPEGAPNILVVLFDDRLPGRRSAAESICPLYKSLPTTD